MFVPKLLQNGEPQRAEILRDDSSGGFDGFRIKTFGFDQPFAGNPKKTLVNDTSDNKERFCDFFLF